MDAETLARAQEPFFTTKGVGKGTGLGLPMVQGLAAQSQGRLTLRSRVGEGTTAEMWFPIAEAGAQAETVSVAPSPHVSSRSLTVLVVDDDPLVSKTQRLCWRIWVIARLKRDPARTPSTFSVTDKGWTSSLPTRPRA